MMQAEGSTALSPKQEQQQQQTVSNRTRKLRTFVSTMHALTQRTQAMYSWAAAAAAMWVEGDAAFAPLVQAAAEVAAWHLQHMADISRINKLLMQQGRRKLRYPHSMLDSAAAAVEISEVYLSSLIRSVQRHNLQQQLLLLLQPQQGQQQQRQRQVGAGSDTAMISPEVELILQDRDRYRELLLLLCATVLGSEALQLQRLVRRSQRRQQCLQEQQQHLQEQQQQQAIQVTSATAAVDATDVAAVAAAVFGRAGAAATTAGAAVITSRSVDAAIKVVTAAVAPAHATLHATRGSSSGSGSSGSGSSGSGSGGSGSGSSGSGSGSGSSSSGSSGSGSDTAALSAACPTGSCIASGISAAAAAALSAEQALLLCAPRLRQEVPAWLSAIPGWGVLLQGAWGDMGYPTELQDEINNRGVLGYNTVSSSSSASSTAAAYQQSVDACIDKWGALLHILLHPLRVTDSLVACSQAVGALQPA
jgi:hypothetical protein